MIIFLKKIFTSLFRKDHSNWTLTVFKCDLKKIFETKNINKNIFKNIHFIKNKKNEFSADPFLFKYKKKEYVFYEKFYKIKNKGVISVAILKNNKLFNERDILVKNYHLSYPNIFKHNKDIYLIPESYQANKLMIYKFTNFPKKLKLVKTFFNNEIVVDPTFFKYKNSIWFFLNKTNEHTENLNKDLFLYKMNKDFTKIIPHKQNPIKTDLYGGRSAGSIIKYKNKYIRPAQINKKNIYGYGLVFFEIKKLDLNSYVEKKITEILPKYFKNCEGVHHFSHSKDKILLDLNLVK